MTEHEIIDMSGFGPFCSVELDYPGGTVSIGGEPHGSVSTPVVTLNVIDKDADAVLYLTAAEALEVWTGLGLAIEAASGNPPKPVKLISD